jgi:CIC family chloride channel protein
MTGNLSLLAPAMIAVAISTILVGDNTIYRSQLPNRAASPAHRVRFSFPLLSSLLVRDAMSAPGPTVAAATPAAGVVAAVEGDPAGGAVLLNDQAEVLGMIRRTRLAQLRPGDGQLAARQIAESDPILLSPDQTLDVALEKLTERGLNWAPVVENRHLVGRLLTRDIVQEYKQTLQRSVRRATALTAGSVLFEARLEPDSSLAGRALRDLGLPPKALIISVVRSGATIFPRADTRLEAGDIVMIMADTAGEAALRTFLAGTSCLLPAPAGSRQA